MAGDKEKSEMQKDLELFDEVPWNSVDIKQHFDTAQINKDDAEDMLAVQNFSENGTFLVRLDIQKGPNHLLSLMAELHQDVNSFLQGITTLLRIVENETFTSFA